MKTKTTNRPKPTYPLTRAQVEQLKALEGRAPDTADIPSAPDAHWSRAERDRHYAAMPGKYTGGRKS
jgi:hypothetical protein